MGFIPIIVEFLNKEKYIKGVFRTNYNFDDSDYEYHFVISRSKSDFLLLANIDHNNNDSKKLINSFNEMLDLNIENKLQFFIDEFRKTTDDKILKFVVIKKMSKKKILKNWQRWLSIYFEWIQIWRNSRNI